ncbi:MAG: MOSC domain-containing protein [Chloroflexi bacterium]|nr:MOSC domain-containing protein [Chloroflexota bacterium]
MERIGQITTIHRYPVKSMGGERLAAAPVTLQGVALDRMYAFVQAGSKSVFPWLTGREAPEMLFYSATVMPGKPPVVTVRTPAGAEFAADDPALLAELEALAKRPVHCLPNYRGSFDVAPVSVIASSTVEAIAKASGTAPDPLRFRMNFLIDTGAAPPFAENGWVGRILRLGETARIAITEPDKRCVMVTLAHPAGAASPAVLRAAAEANGAAAGAYAAVLTPGEVREGDDAWLE